jgi:hypothetical protein
MTIRHRGSRPKLAPTKLFSRPLRADKRVIGVSPGAIRRSAGEQGLIAAAA